MTEHDPVYCGPDRGEERPSRETDGTTATAATLRTDPADADDERTTAMTRLDGGTFTMGADSGVGFPQDGEGRPAR